MKYKKIEIGKSDIHRNPKVAKGWSVWLEWGIYYKARTVNPRKFGKHDYFERGAYERGVHDCKCGCSMHDSSSSGPVDPFGACPLNPLPNNVGLVKR